MGEARVINCGEMFYYTTDARLHVLFACFVLCKHAAIEDSVAELAAEHACRLGIGSRALPVFGGGVHVLLVQLGVVGGRHPVLDVGEAVLPLCVRIQALHPALAEQLRLLAAAVALALLVVLALHCHDLLGLVLDFFGDNLCDVDGVHGRRARVGRVRSVEGAESPRGVLPPRARSEPASRYLGVLLSGCCCGE